VDVNVASRACGAPALDPTRRTRKDHTTEGLRAILQKRLDTTRAFHFLGPARYVRHESEQPMAITWKLECRLPGDLYQSFAAAVA
jgi:hypothetical protein